MTWISHKLATGAVVFAVTGNPVPALFAAAGSIIPDALEGFPKNESDYDRWRKNHRRMTHWFVPYMVIAAVLYCVAFSFGVRPLGTVSLSHFSSFAFFANKSLYGFLAYAFSYMAIGAVLHCVQDALCGAVPSLNPQKRVGTRFFYVGSFKEFALVLPASAALILARLGL
jgi:hypothetical protein